MRFNEVAYLFLTSMFLVSSGEKEVKSTEVVGIWKPDMDF